MPWFFVSFTRFNGNAGVSELYIVPLIIAFFPLSGLENLGTSAVVFGYLLGITFFFLMAWTLRCSRKEKKDISGHSRV